jgi:nucleotide-binding universal stress UspA family protein
VALEDAMMEMHRILAATDFSPAGHLAVARAGQLATQYQCELLVFHATPDWTLFSQRASARQEYYADITRNADELMRDEINWLGQEYGLHTARGEIHRDRATLAIARVIESFQPNVLVAGAGGEHIVPGGETVLGGTALKLIARVGVPLLLVRRSPEAVYASTLAAIGGEAGTARRLVQWASSLAGSGRCHVVRAYDAPYANRMRLCRYGETQIVQAAEEQRRIAQQDCEALEHALPPGTHLIVHVVRGAPVPTVLAQVKEYAPELIVIGQHQRRAEEHPGAWTAGVGTRIAYHCPTDVLMIPAVA